MASTRSTADRRPLRPYRGLGVAAALAVAGVAALLLVRADRGGDSAVASPGAHAAAIVTGEAAASSPEAPRVPARVAPSPGPAQHADDHGATSPAPPSRAETLTRLDGARAKLREAARPCWRAHAATPRPAAPRGMPDETLGMLRVRYALVVHAGEAEVENVEVLESTIGDGALDTCIRDAVVRARWPATGADGMLEVEDLLRIGDLTLPEADAASQLR